ncbi:MAG: hypothetical protein FWB83_00925 [Treponema sp.]|nr:hypothetical protein [Treponema sp.]
MGIAPIDLQAIFSQVDKVGRAQLAERDGQALLQSLQGTQIQKKAEELLAQVNEAQNTGEGAEKVKDRARGQKKENKKKANNENEEAEEEEANEGPKNIIHDPSLGKKIDISY